MSAARMGTMRIASLAAVAAAAVCLTVAAPVQAASSCHNQSVTTAGDPAYGIPGEPLVLMKAENMTCSQAAAILSSWTLGVDRHMRPNRFECFFFRFSRKSGPHYGCQKWMASRRDFRSFWFKKVNQG